MMFFLQFLLQATQASLQTSQINEIYGLVKINTGDEEIINLACTILHIINIREIEGILHNTSSKIEIIDLLCNSILRNEIDLIRS